MWQSAHAGNVLVRLEKKKKRLSWALIQFLQLPQSDRFRQRVSESKPDPVLSTGKPEALSLPSSHQKDVCLQRSQIWGLASFLSCRRRFLDDVAFSCGRKILWGILEIAGTLKAEIQLRNSLSGPEQWASNAWNGDNHLLGPGESAT